MRLLVLITVYLFTLTAYSQSLKEDTIYYKCAKWVNFDSSEFKNLTFSVSGADTIISSPSIILIPTDSSVKLKVITKKKLFKEYSYKVIPTPLPTVEVWINNKSINKTNNIVYEYTLKAIPDEEFANEAPRECRYRVMEHEVKVLRGGKIVKQNLGMNNFGSIIHTELRTNDIVVIEVTKVLRMNFRNEKDELSIKKKLTFTVNNKPLIKIIR